MQSVLDEELTAKEREVLAAYRSPLASDMRRQVRLSVQYAVGSGIFTFLCLSTGQPLYGLAVYVIFILWMGARLLGASRVCGIVPGIIEKYERRVAAMEVELKQREPSADG
jgi:hypothetical protein